MKQNIAKLQMMDKKIMMMCASLFLGGSTFAQKIDFNISGRNANQVTEPEFTPWALAEAKEAQQMTIGNVAISVATNGGTMKCNWWKDGVQKYSKLTGDALVAYPQKKSASIVVTIKGMKAGKHTLLAYHNNTDGTESAKISIFVDGKKTAEGISQSCRAEKVSESAISYIEFTAKEGKSVKIEYKAESALFINALLLDVDNPKDMASDPVPANRDIHADGDNGTIRMSWKNAASAVKSHVYVGTSQENMKEVSTEDDNDYTLHGVYSMNTYYWRVDEENKDGKITRGETWTFKPRHLAFPGAEGYGRFATGGRGGIVYHVTNLNDDNKPGSLRYGIENVHGARTIVFDVAGTIVLKERLACGDNFVTIAGQTAPGNGILLARSPFGVSYESQVRFMRLRLGSGKTADGMGCAGAQHSIFDHNSIGWTIDESFSTRGAKNFTFQHNMISEALNIAGHQNYKQGKMHGYAATIGGDIGSYHHNLLAHCEGRNWSMGGGLDGAGYYAGRLDIFNNVCYNWGSRATDGGAHEVNFVNNYYKMGGATKQKFLFSLDLEGTGMGSQSAYISGNIRENLDGTTTPDIQGETYRYTLKHNQKLTWKPFADKPYFPSQAKIESAKAAYKNVLSDAGCNQPMLDAHDTRIVKETLTKTAAFKGSKSGLPGLIDADKDAGGFEAYPVPVVYREADFDTDGDGLPNWWENMHGTNPNSAKNDFSDSNADPNHDGYTNLEEYLNWLAVPHFILNEGDKMAKLDLTTYFAGYDNKPSFAVSADGVSFKLKKNMLSINTKKLARGFYTFSVTATDADNVSSLTRQFNIAIK